MDFKARCICTKKQLRYANPLLSLCVVDVLPGYFIFITASITIMINGVTIFKYTTTAK
jgi:hypothetical protein